MNNTAEIIELAREVEKEARENEQHQPLRLADYYSQTPPPFDFILPAFLLGTVGLMIGPGGSGKSMLALQLAHSVATGQSGLGIECGPTPARVVILNGEDPAQVIHHRAHAIGTRLSASERIEADENLKIYECVGSIKNIFDEEFLQATIKKCTDARLVIIDTLRRFHAGEENDNGQMSALIGRLEMIAKQTGAAVLAIHHVGKQSNDPKAPAQSGRGASALTDNSRFVGSVRKMTAEEGKTLGVAEADVHKYLGYEVSKQNYSAQPVPIWLRRGEGGVLSLANFGGGEITQDMAQGGRTQQQRPSRLTKNEAVQNEGW
jgi:regulatory protein RepA